MKKDLLLKLFDFSVSEIGVWSVLIYGMLGEMYGLM